MMCRVLALALAMIVWLCAATFASPDTGPLFPKPVSGCFNHELLSDTYIHFYESIRFGNLLVVDACLHNLSKPLPQSVRNYGLLLAVHHNQFDAMKHLVAAGAEVTHDNNAAVKEAYRQNNAVMVNYLIAQGADLNLPETEIEWADSVTGCVAVTLEQDTTVVGFINWEPLPNYYMEGPPDFWDKEWLPASWLERATLAERQPRSPGPKLMMSGPLGVAAPGRAAPGKPSALNFWLTLVILGSIILLASAFLLVEKYYWRTKHNECAANECAAGD